MMTTASTAWSRTRSTAVPSEVAEISDAIPVGAAAGTRYPEPQMKSLYL